MPRADLLGPDDEAVTLTLDPFDDRLVACAQVLTRRGGSVFLDPSRTRAGTSIRRPPWWRGVTTSPARTFAARTAAARRSETAP